MANKCARGPIYQLDIQVPRDVKEACKSDKNNGNTKWQDAMQEEGHFLLDATTFRDKEKLFLKGI